MSEEESSGNNAAVVLMEQDSNRQETIYRPLELKDDADIHKDVFPAAQSTIISEKQNETVIKNLPPNLKRWEPPPDSFEIIALQSDKRPGVIIPPSYPIPADVHSINSSEEQEKEAAQKDESNEGDNDTFTEQIEQNSIVEEIKNKQQLEWSSSSQDVKKKVVSWNKKSNGQTGIWQDIDLQSHSITDMQGMHRCPRYAMYCSGASGISINIPKKSSRSVNQRSVINITITKKSTTCATSKNCHRQELITNGALEKKLVDKQRKSQFFSVLKSKVSNFHKKIKNTLQM